MDEKTESDVADRGVEGEPGHFCLILSALFQSSFLSLPAQLWGKTAVFPFTRQHS